MDIFKLHGMFRKPFDSVSITLIDAHSCVHIYASLVSAVRCSKVYLRAKLIRLHISPHSRLNQGPVPQSALKGWNIVFGHTNQFYLDHVLRPGYCDVVTFRLTIDQLDQIDHVLRPWYRDVWTKWGSCHLRNVPGKHSKSPHRFPLERDLWKKGSVCIIQCLQVVDFLLNAECFQVAGFLLLYRW